VITPDTSGRKRPDNLFLVVFLLLVFLILFSYTSLNLKNVDYGYRMQELEEREKVLQEEIDLLQAKKSRLLNLSRVEKVVTTQLGYQYPTPDQIIQVQDK
jgi:cell division protein FtsL